MPQRDVGSEGAFLVARLLAGAPADDMEPTVLPVPWSTLARAIVSASADQRLPAFGAALSGLPASQAAEIRTQVGKAGRVILQGSASATLRPEIASADLLDLPPEAQIAPAVQQAGQGVGKWLSDYVAFAADVSERTPHLFHEAIGLWIGGLAIARRLRLRLRHGDICPNLYVLGVADTTLYAKSTGLEVGSRLIHDCFPHLLFANDFTPEAMLSDLAGREPANLHAAGLPTPVRELRFEPLRRWRFDLAWPQAMLAAEVEGGTWAKGRHVRGPGYEKDCEKLNAAALLGWRVLRFTAEMVEDGRALEAVRQALGPARGVR